jgi:hypothetical protein
MTYNRLVSVSMENVRSEDLSVHLASLWQSLGLVVGARFADFLQAWTTTAQSRQSQSIGDTSPFLQRQPDATEAFQQKFVYNCLVWWRTVPVPYEETPSTGPRIMKDSGSCRKSNV